MNYRSVKSLKLFCTATWRAALCLGVSTVVTNWDWGLSICQDQLLKPVEIFSTVEINFFLCLSQDFFNWDFLIKNWLCRGFNQDCQDFLCRLIVTFESCLKVGVAVHFWVAKFFLKIGKNVLVFLTSFSKLGRKFVPNLCHPLQDDLFDYVSQKMIFTKCRILKKAEKHWRSNNYEGTHYEYLYAFSFFWVVNKC
jgi:hypothetical protein